jgi:hypothetical protein
METQGLSLAQQVRYLEIDLLKARQENTALRKALHQNSRHVRRVEKAYEDALLLAAWRSSGIIPSRRYAKQYGLTQNRWQNAMALLKLARVVERQRRWVTEDPAVAEKKLEKAKARAMADPQLFFLRLNRHGRR